ncbi:probable UDP-sugar transporter protein SLC35A4 [Polypterus senegalus]
MVSLDLMVNKEPIFTWVSWGPLLFFMVLIYGSHAPLITLCKVNGKIPFNPSSCVVLIELLKFLVSLVLLVIQDAQSLRKTVSRHHVAPYAVPAVLYAFNNNIMVYMQEQMDPSTFQILSNLKIASTAVLYSAFLRKRLAKVQWVALGLLMLAGACHSFSCTSRDEEGEAEEGMRLHVTAPGLLFLLVYCLVSGLAAVYTEVILKTQRLPLNLQNLFLYLFGICINYGSYLVTGSNQSFFEGYSVWVVMIVITQVWNGLLTSLVMKHSNNITRLFVISCSMLVNAVLSVLLFDLQLTPLFFLTAALIAGAVCLYYYHK